MQEREHTRHLSHHFAWQAERQRAVSPRISVDTRHHALRFERNGGLRDGSGVGVSSGCRELSDMQAIALRLAPARHHDYIDT